MRPQAAALKALLDEPRLQVMPGCGDGMGARLIEEAGFRTGFVSGSERIGDAPRDAGHGSGEFQRNGRCG